MSKHRETESTAPAVVRTLLVTLSVILAGLLAATTYAAASGPDHDGHDSSDSAGRAVVNSRTATKSTSAGSVTVLATCHDDEVPVNGYPLVDGEDLYNNPKASYSLGDTGERRNGFQVQAGPGLKLPIFGQQPSPPVAQPREITAVVRCLVVAR